jgi:hypothetical protein
VTYLRLMLLVVTAWVVGFASGYWAGRPKAAPSPLKVTILDDGGAKLKVETCIVEEKK